MSEVNPYYTPNFFDKFIDGDPLRSVVASIKNVFVASKKRIDTLRLNSKLAHAIKRADGLRVSGVEKGDAKYIALKNDAYISIQTYCNEYNMKVEDLEAENPGVLFLKEMSEVEASSGMAGKIVIGLIIVMAVLTLIGLSAGYVLRIAHLVAGSV